ncbi:uncharacterized protein SPSK_10547 [Sporothrix schenckii 1099-18]|uniref:Uncharacterized protein n=1 Tax=Sporothrix schenckii 1099-18 TaxID=1397361 RepID=A0A0F2M1C2_SPOSC|nr:uncharacterized protein SPSK_10547 [Sporothrix schenckii 1099-18]KJR82555.1 hypothetical protein SPSK_10547 [Sporothrix schenckii 1099-18]
MQAEETRAESLERGTVALNKADENGDLVARQTSAANGEDIPNRQEGGGEEGAGSRCDEGTNGPSKKKRKAHL